MLARSAPCRSCACHRASTRAQCAPSATTRSIPCGNFTPEGPSETGFVLPPSNVGVKDARDFIDASEIIAARAAADVKKLTGCARGAVDQACFNKFITTLGRRAYRRPLSPDEITDLVTLHSEAAAAGADEPTALSVVVESTSVAELLAQVGDWFG